MTCERRHIRRLLVGVLLALMVSPLTAPFSSGHPLDLLGGTAAHIQSKKAPDDPIVSLAMAPVVFAPLSAEAGDTTPGPVKHVVTPHTHKLPLRL